MIAWTNINEWTNMNGNEYQHSKQTRRLVRPAAIGFHGLARNKKDVRNTTTIMIMMTPKPRANNQYNNGIY